MPSKVYRHPGGLREERAHLLSSSDGPDYNSGNEGASSSLVCKSKSASLELVAELNDNREATVDVHDVFTDLTEDEALLNQSS